MDFGQPFEVLAILRPIGEPLEADDAAQAGHREDEAAVIGLDGIRSDRLEVQGRRATPEEVDQPSVGDNSKMLLTEQVLVANGNGVPLTDPAELPKRRKDPTVIGGIVRDEEIDVLGRADESIGDYREAANDDEASAGTEHRPCRDVELRVAG